MPNCKNCKYWTKIDTDLVNFKEYGECPRVTEALFVSDANGIVINIAETYEDFGCILHKEKSK